MRLVLAEVQQRLQLGKRNQVRGEIRIRFIDYAFKAGWLMFGGLMMFVLVHSQSLLGL